MTNCKACGKRLGAADWLGVQWSKEVKFCWRPECRRVGKNRVWCAENKDKRELSKCKSLVRKLFGDDAWEALVQREGVNSE